WPRAGVAMPIARRAANSRRDIVAVSAIEVSCPVGRRISKTGSCYMGTDRSGKSLPVVELKEYLSR
ncbi:hypothetical protein NQ243_25920, partial [Escherichia coli]|nr:hypothetical protein [Escherichia coli]